MVILASKFVPPCDLYHPCHAQATSTLDPKPVLGVTMATGSGPLQAGVDMVFSTARAMKSAREAAAEAAQRRAGRGAEPMASIRTILH